MTQDRTSHWEKVYDEKTETELSWHQADPEVSLELCKQAGPIASAVERARQQTGEPGKSIDWVVADVTTWTPERTFDLWHDRAVFHFLVDREDRAAYIDRLGRALRPGGHAIPKTGAPIFQSCSRRLPLAVLPLSEPLRRTGPKNAAACRSFDIAQRASARFWARSSNL